MCVKALACSLVVLVSTIGGEIRKIMEDVILRFVLCSCGAGSVIRLVGQAIEPWLNNSHIPCVFRLFTHELRAKWPAKVGFSL